MRIAPWIAELVDAEPGRECQPCVRWEGPIPHSNASEDRTLLSCQGRNSNDYERNTTNPVLFKIKFVLVISELFFSEIM